LEELKENILKTLAYADIFDFPLTLFEIHQYLIGARDFSPDEIKRDLKDLVVANLLGNEGDLFFLPRREGLTKIKKLREEVSRSNLKNVWWALRIIGLLPWVKMVALTGAAAVNNNPEEGDIDLMVVTSQGRLWLTRFLVFLFLEIVGLKRKDGSRNPAGKFCINVWCDEGRLKVLPEDQDLVVAHEVAQAKPLINKEGVYEKFVSENLWLKNYLPNWKA